MYKCPYRERQNEKTADEHIEHWYWHHTNCTCQIMELFHFMIIDQDDHVRAYWESEGKQRVRWDVEYGMLLEYPNRLMDMLEIRYPYS